MYRQEGKKKQGVYEMDIGKGGKNEKRGNETSAIKRSALVACCVDVWKFRTTTFWLAPFFC